IGFGTYQLQGDICYQAVSTALEVGYRYIDTADRYQNQQEVGKAIQQSQLKRDELFVTSKIWHTNQYTKQIIDDAQRFLDELQLEYLDLLLVHWPNRSIPIQETVDGFLKVLESGYVKHVGVSNCTVHHLEDFEKAGFPIENNQIEFHPSLNQHELLTYCQSKNIVVTAYSPLAQGDDLHLDTVTSLAQKYEKSPAQIVLNWIRQKGVVPIPRSESKEHIVDNYQSIHWGLTEEDIALLNQVDQNHRVINPPFGDFDY
ncbi:aldo/keto reductase, partial [candidate division WWE3 bacterium]|nr:aldo/keto reductase [candidate division WWE3 bacterium]